MLNQNTRAWTYRVLTAAGPILTFYGWVSEQAWPLWLGFGGAILGTGLAAVNTAPDTKGKHEADE